MPVAVHISAKQMSHEDYERVIADLGGPAPDGRRYHAAYGDDGLQIFEVWDSQEQFEDHNDKLMAHLQSIGIGGGNVEVHPLHAHAYD